MKQEIKYWLAKKMVSRSKAKPRLSLKELETKHRDPAQPLFNDSSYFNGHGADGAYFVVRQSFRTTRGNEYWLKLFFPNLGEFELKNFEGKEGEGFQQGPLRFECVELGQRWKVLYEGDIWQGETKHHINIDLLFEGQQPLVNFADATLPERTAKVISKPPWSRSFFKKLAEMKKTHVEQGGLLKGTITLDGKTSSVNWTSVRDHSWGIRNWNTWDRHVWLSGLLENGETFNASFITYPYLSGLSAGYLTKNGKIHYLREAPSLSEFTNHHPVAKEQTILLEYSEGEKVELSWKIYGNFDFIMDGNYNIYEGMAEYNLNGVKGLGVAEFGAIEHVSQTNN